VVGRREPVLGPRGSSERFLSGGAPCRSQSSPSARCERAPPFQSSNRSRRPILNELGFTAGRAPKKAATDRCGRKSDPLALKLPGIETMRGLIEGGVAIIPVAGVDEAGSLADAAEEETLEPIPDKKALCAVLPLPI
jgi:hypothetical protein